MRRLLLSASCALLLLLATAGVALMAPVTQSLGGAAGVTCSYTYDDTSALITDFTLNNEDSAAHVMTAFVLDSTTLQVIASRSVSVPAVSTRSFNVSPLGIHMVDRIGKDGTHYLGLPAPIGCAVS